MPSSNSGGSIEPSFQFVVVTPSDTAPLKYTTSSGFVEEKRCKALYIGGAGNVAINDDAGNSVTFVGVLAGSVIPVSTENVLNTGTTATNIVALF